MSGELTLEIPSERLRDAFIEMAMEFAEHGSSRYVGAARDFSTFLSRVRDEAEGRNLPPGAARTWWFFLVQDDRVLGASRFRPELTPDLEHEGGNIGYDIRPSARGRGFGTAILRLTLERAAAAGLTRVRITCDADNIGSIRVIEKNGGVLDAEAPARDRAALIRQYWIALADGPRGVEAGASTEEDH